MSQIIISDVKGRRVWDSRGRPTVEAEITLNDGTVTRAIAPAGASTGAGEAIDLRDGGTYLDGWGVSRAVNNVNGEIKEILLGKDISEQAELDNALIALDGTKNKSRLGGNAMVAVSMAALKAAAASKGLELWKYLNGDKQDVVIPLPEIQIFGGGAHAAGRLDIQDLMVMPVGAETFSEATEWVARIYISAGKIMQERGTLNGVADEGGYWPAFASNEEALETLMLAIEKAGLKPGDDIVISLDIAANQFYKDGYYHLSLEKEKLSSDGLHALLGHWIQTFPIASIEDPFAEHEKQAFIKFTTEYGDKVQIIGDDYLVTNAARVVEAGEDRAVNAALIKANQAGTITETYKALRAAEKLNWGTIVSARSGESEDTTIAHLSIGWRSGQLKVGSFARSERLAKWNEVLRIEEKTAGKAIYQGRNALCLM
jgi:enolase 1/2/3